MNRMRNWLVRIKYRSGHALAVSGICLCAIVIVGCSAVVNRVDRCMNPVLGPDSKTYSGFSECFLESRSDQYLPHPGKSPIGTPPLIDLHADTLLWGRNFIKGDTRGHVDLPRLCAGNYAVQVFTVVTKYPDESANKFESASGLPAKDLPVRCYSGSSFNTVTPLAIAHIGRKHWGLKAITNLRSRAIAQIDTFDEYVTKSKVELRQLIGIRTREDLKQVAYRFPDRTEKQCVVGGLLGFEGLHFINPKDPIGDMKFFYDRGLRIASLTHHFDNLLAGSSTGCALKGLEPMGEKVLRFMFDKGIVLDLAHASSKTIRDALAIKARYEKENDKSQIPFFVSHTGVTSHCPNSRNMTDADIRIVAKSGGVIGIIYWPEILCCSEHCSQDKVLDAVAQAYAETYRILSDCYERGVCKKDGSWPDSASDHLALGSDFDGAIPSPVDSSTIYQVLDRLRKTLPAESQSAVTDTEIPVLHKIGGYNACKVIAHVLPQQQAESGQSESLALPDICDDLYSP